MISFNPQTFSRVLLTMHKTRTKFREYILQDFKYKKSEISLIG
jgi:hypothetical protein